MAKKNKVELSARQKLAAKKLCVICGKEFTNQEVLEERFIYVKAKSGRENLIHNKCMRQEVKEGWRSRTT